MDYLHHMTIFYTSGNTPSTFFYLRYLEEVAGKMTRQQLPVPFSPINLENTLGAWLTCYTWPRWRFLEKSSSQRSLSVSTPTSRMPSRCAIGQILNGPNHVKLAICIPTWLHWRNRQKLANFLLCSIPLILDLVLWPNCCWTMATTSYFHFHRGRILSGIHMITTSWF